MVREVLRVRPHAVCRVYTAAARNATRGVFSSVSFDKTTADSLLHGIFVDGIMNVRESNFRGGIV